MRTVIGRDERARTAHQTATDTPAELLPDRVASLVRAHQQTVTRRRVAYQKAERRQRDRAIRGPRSQDGWDHVCVQEYGVRSAVPSCGGSSGR